MEKANIQNVTARTAARWGLVGALLTFPVAILVDHFAPGRGTPAGASLMMMIGAVGMFWHLRRHAWFWMAIAALTCIHVALVVIVPWNKWAHKSFPAPELWPIGMADVALIVGFIKLIERAMRRGDGASARA